MHVKLIPWVTFNRNTLRVILICHSENAKYTSLVRSCVCASLQWVSSLETNFVIFPSAVIKYPGKGNSRENRFIPAQSWRLQSITAGRAWQWEGEAAGHTASIIASWRQQMHADSGFPPLVTWSRIPAKNCQQPEWEELPTSINTMKIIYSRHTQRHWWQLIIDSVKLTLIIHKSWPYTQKHQAVSQGPCWWDSQRLTL